VLGQLGNRVQHALRAFTPDDQAALNKAVRTYPKTDDYDLERDLQALGTGEAIVTVLSEKGAPTPVAWARMRAPRSFMGTLDPAGLDAGVKQSALWAEYSQVLDRESAYEKLNGKLAQAPADAPGAPAPEGAPQQLPAPAPKAPAPKPKNPEDSAVEKVLKSSAFKSFTRSMATVLGREITRSVFGTRKR